MPHSPVFALLHGGGQGSWVWNDTARALEQSGARVVLLDVPGCGTKRTRETIALNVEDVVDELIDDVRRDAPGGDLVLVGHSQAGTLLPAMWARQPSGLFKRLVYVSASAPLDGQSVLDMMGRGLHGQHPDQVGWPLDPDTYDKLAMRRVTMCNDMTESQISDFMAQQDIDSWPMGVTYACSWSYDHLRGVPSSFIVCERDQILPPVWQRRFAERLFCTHLLPIDAGHQAMNTQPATLAKLLMETALQ